MGVLECKRIEVQRRRERRVGVVQAGAADVTHACQASVVPETSSAIVHTFSLGPPTPASSSAPHNLCLRWVIATMIPMGMDYRPTRAELEGRAAVPEPDAVQRTMTQAGEGVVAAWVDLEETLGDVLEGAPREVAVPAVCCVASGHALFVRLFEVGNDAAVPAEVRTPHNTRAVVCLSDLRERALRVRCVTGSRSARPCASPRTSPSSCSPVAQPSTASASRKCSCAGAADPTRRPGSPPPSTQPLLSSGALSAYVSLAFYLLIYPDPVFQATVVAKARSADARTHARTHARTFPRSPRSCGLSR